MAVVWVVIGVGLLFGLTAFRGAPYVPAHRRQVEIALDLLRLRPGEVLVDLGSGDGVVLKAAAERGLLAYGYEINPVLCLIAWLRCWRYRSQVKVLWRDFWLSELPPQTKAVFVFAAGPFMKKLARKFAATVSERHASLLVASYGFELAGQTPIASRSGVHIYRYQPASPQ